MAKEKISTVTDSGEKIVTRYPNITETQEADWEFSRVFNKAIRSGIPPRASLLKEMMEIDLWTQDEEDKLFSLRNGLDTKQTELNEARNEDPIDEDKIEELIAEIKAIQQQIMPLSSKLESLLAHTAENKAGDAKLYYLTALVSEKEDGSRLWKDIAAFRNDTNAERMNTAIIQFMLLQSGLSPELREEIQEQVSGSDDSSTK